MVLKRYRDYFSYAGGANDSSYDKWSFKLITHPSGLEADGSIDLNVVNLEWLTKLEADVDPDGAGAAGRATDLSKTEVTDGILSIDAVSIEVH